MSALEPVTLTGRRAILRPMELSDAAGLLAAGADPAVWRYMPARMPQTEADMQGLIRPALSDRAVGMAMPFTIWDRDSQSIVGSTRLTDFVPAHRQVEIGWTWLSPSVWRTRINTECKFMLLGHCFETLGLIRVQLKADARNERSLRAMERIGAVREGVLRRHRVLPDGFVRDSVYYSVIVEEWPAVKARLEEILDRDRAARGSG